jgi:4-hydroxy-tetrahydrodipicolinate synthase
MKKNCNLHGVIVPVHTPFNDDLSIDFGGLLDDVRKLCDDGVHGLMILGSNGEFGNLAIEERKKIAEMVIAEVGSRIPIVVHVGSSKMSDVQDLAGHAQKTGASAVMCLPPYLLNPNQEDIYQYFTTIAKKLNIDMVLYNNPGPTNIMIDPLTIARLAKVEQINYLKDSGRNLRHTSDIIQAVDDSMVVLSGEADLFLPILALGGKGGIVVPSLVAPIKTIEMYEAAVKGDMEQARKVHYQLMELLHVLVSEGRYRSAVKAALNIQGRAGGRTRPPISDISETCKRRLRQVLKKIGVL